VCQHACLSGKQTAACQSECPLPHNVSALEAYCVHMAHVRRYDVIVRRKGAM